MTIKGKFYVPIYNCRVKIYVSDRLKRVIDRIYKKHGYDPIETEPGGLCYNPESKEVATYYLFFDKENLSLNFLNHEQSHLTEYILTDRGIKPRDEVRAFLDGFLSDKIHKFFRVRKIKLK